MGLSGGLRNPGRNFELVRRANHENWAVTSIPQLTQWPLEEVLCWISGIWHCSWNAVGTYSYEMKKRMNKCTLRMHSICPG